MIVQVSGKTYEISGVMWGTLPAWKLIKTDGEPMTGPQFNSLPDADKNELFAYVQQHLANLSAAKANKP